MARGRTAYGNCLAAASGRAGSDGDFVGAVGMTSDGDGVIPCGRSRIDIAPVILRRADSNGIVSDGMTAYGSRIRALGSRTIPYFHRMVSFGVAPYRYRVSTLGGGTGSYLHRIVPLGMSADSDRAFLLCTGPGTDGYAVLPHGCSPVSVSGGIFSRRIGLGTHGCSIVPLGHSTDPGRQGIVPGGSIVQVVVVPSCIRCFRGLHAVIMGHGFFQLGQVDCVAVFTAGGHMGDLTAGTAIANGQSPFPGLPSCTSLDGCSARLRVPAGDTAGAVCFRTFAQGNRTFHAGLCFLADGYTIFFGYGRITYGYSRIIGRGSVTDGYGITTVGGDFCAGSDRVVRRLIECDRIKMVRIVGFLVVVDRLTIFLVSLTGIAGDFGFGHFFTGIRIFFCIRMDILGRSAGVAICIPEHLGHLSGITILIFVPDSLFCISSLIAICIGIVGNRFVSNFRSIADSRGIIPFSMIVVAYSRGATRFRGSSQISSFSFTTH